jgi:hypothetical protein
MKLFSVIYNDAALLGHFLKHYADAGVDEFIMATSPAFAGEISKFKKSYQITFLTDLDVVDTILNGNMAVTQMREARQGVDEWAIIVDLDEFVDFREPIEAVISAANNERANVVRGVMYDRFSRDGKLSGFLPDSDLEKVYPIKSRFIRNVMQTGDHKGVFVRGHLRPVAGVGHHLFHDERVCSKLLEISHYKWTLGAIDRLRESHRLRVEAGRPPHLEYQRALNHYDRYGRFAWEIFGGRQSDEFIAFSPEYCSECPAPLTEAEYEFSINRYGRALCRSDQKRYSAR